MAEITHVSEDEGGRWVPWAEWRARPVPDRRGKRIHAWRLADGSLWDAYGGLRPEHLWGRFRPVEIIDGTGWAEAAFCDDVDPAQREPKAAGMAPCAVNDAMRQQMASANWCRRDV